MTVFYDRQIETMSRAKMRELQLERLKFIVDYAYQNVPMYRAKFDAVGLKPAHIRTLKQKKRSLGRPTNRIQPHYLSINSAHAPLYSFKCSFQKETLSIYACFLDSTSFEQFSTPLL